jgi:NADH-quinone oxidoreductase subunit L
MKAFTQGSYLFWIIGWITAAMTAFYMFRLVVLTFEGKERWGQDKHPHESPRVMTLPLIILAVLSIIGGFVGIPSALGGSNMLEKWLEPVFERANLQLAEVHETGLPIEYMLMVLSVIAGVAGILFARSFFSKASHILTKPTAAWYKILWNKYYVDEIYDFAVVAPTVRASEKLLWKGVDTRIIDGLVNGTAKLISLISGQLRKIQMGVAQGYALAFVVGIIIVLGILLLK